MLSKKMLVFVLCITIEFVGSRVPPCILTFSISSLLSFPFRDANDMKLCMHVVAVTATNEKKLNSSIFC